MFGLGRRAAILLGIGILGLGGGIITQLPGAGPAFAAPAHVETWAYDDCGNGGLGATSALVRQWVTYAEANCGPGGDSKTQTDCHSGGTTFCNVMQYLDTNIIFPTAGGNQSPQWPSWNTVAAETWYLHIPGSNTVRLASGGANPGTHQNQNIAAVQSFYQNYVRTNHANADGLFMDDQGAGISAGFFDTNTCAGSPCTSSQEITTDAQFRAAHAAMSAAMTRAGGGGINQADNTIPDCGNPNLAQGVGTPTNMLTGNVTLMVAEGCPMFNGVMASSSKIAGFLDDVAWVENNTTGAVVFLSYAPNGAVYLPQERLVQEAMDLLAYKPGQLVDWADLEQFGPNPLAVWPEEGIYPTQPVTTMTSPAGANCFAINGSNCDTGGHNTIQVQAGVYVREFAKCYNQSTLFNQCAAVLNTTGAAVTVSAGWLTKTYAHSLTTTGGDVQGGGTVNLTGALFTAGTTTVAANSALILTP